MPPQIIVHPFGPHYRDAPAESLAHIPVEGEVAGAVLEAGGEAVAGVQDLSQFFRLGEHILHLP